MILPFCCGGIPLFFNETPKNSGILAAAKRLCREDRGTFVGMTRANLADFLVFCFFIRRMGVVVDSLPIAACKKELIKEICSNKVTIVVGETGSGKTTQIPQYLSKTKLAGKGKMIGVTQPRRVAAISLAQRVSQEMGTVLGNECGYAVRFDNKTNFKTRIKYMTDGLLLKEYVSRNSSFAGYSCIILDEAHERTLRTDILFGLVKRELEKRPNDFKVVIMSATLDADSFSEFFNRYFPEMVLIILQCPGPVCSRKTISCAHHAFFVSSA